MIRYFKFRKAMKQVLANNEEFMRALAESEKNDPYTNLTWQDDDGLYRAWAYNQKQNRYYFNDIGDEMFLKVWEYIFQNDGEDEDDLFEGKLVEL
jgi:hypothetical protein